MRQAAYILGYGCYIVSLFLPCYEDSLFNLRGFEVLLFSFVGSMGLLPICIAIVPLNLVILLGPVMLAVGKGERVWKWWGALLVVTAIPALGVVALFYVMDEFRLLYGAGLWIVAIFMMSLSCWLPPHAGTECLPASGHG